MSNKIVMFNEHKIKNTSLMSKIRKKKLQDHITIQQINLEKDSFFSFFKRINQIRGSIYSL